MMTVRLRSNWARLGIGLAIGWVLLLAFSLALMPSEKAAASEQQIASPQIVDHGPDDLVGICDGVTSIPVEECGALVALYSATDGDNWLVNANWLDLTNGLTPCDWSGVNCDGGHVVGIQLTSNRLVGTLPRSLRHFDRLRNLHVAKNGLNGNVPAAICELADTMTSADFGHNQLTPRAAGARACLDAMDPDWASSQTVPPKEFTIAQIHADGFDLKWTPVANSTVGDHYEISIKNSFGGPYQVHGMTADIATSSYRVDGLPAGNSFFVRVRTVSPGEDGQPAQVSSAPVYAIGVTDASETMLLAVYISADNNLSPNVRSIIERIRQGTETNPNVIAIVLADRYGRDNTDVVHIEGGKVSATNAVMDEWGRTELDVADPDVLTWFLNYARAQASADRMAVSLIGHGVGPAPEVAWMPPSVPGQPQLPPQGGIPPLPQGSEFTPADVTDGSYISTVELGRALLAATDDGASPFDILFFDQCFQGNIDVLYEVRAVSDVFIASPNYAWLIAPYDKYVAQLAPAATNEEIAQNIIERYEGSLNVHHPNAIFWLRSADIDAIATAVGDLGDALRSALNGGREAAILESARKSLYVDTTQCGNQKFELAPPDELLGAGSFARNLRTVFPENDAHGVHAAADDLVALLANVRGASITGSPYIAPEKVWEYTDRITILAPLARQATATTAWRASLYTDKVPITAVWGPDPSERVVISETFAFVRDHTWDEFIGDWYREPLVPTVGIWCYYSPPSLVIDDDAELLMLEIIAAGDGEVTLSWPEAADVDPVAHWVFAKGPLNVARELVAVLEPGTQTIILADLDAGLHRFMVASVDGENIAVAHTSVTDYVVERPAKIYLPFVANP